MIAALYALAAAMIIGGCAAVIQGFPYVRLESGLAMVIAGSVTASSGAVLFGLGAVAAGLRRVERAAGGAPGLRAPEIAEAPASAPEGRPRLPPVLPAAPGFVAPPVVEPPFDPGRPQIEPGADPRENGPALTEAKAAEIEPELPIPGLAPAPPAPEPEGRPEPAETLAAARNAAPEDDLFAAPEAPPEVHEAAPALRPSLAAAPDPEPAAERPPEPPGTVVGRYASGGNTYVMFADGTIEAETPQGRFTFASLDELKAFVDGGGESGRRGAA